MNATVHEFFGLPGGYAVVVMYRTLSQLKRIARAMYSNPPVHGARIVAEVVNEESMFDQWKAEMEMMSGRIMGVRKQLYDELSQLHPERDWGFILSQIGMFSFTGVFRMRFVQTLVLLEHQGLSA